jgi:Flp pilus assembly protein TadB
LAILAINPGYFGPLVSHSFGRVLIAAAVVMVITGSFVIRRIVNIKV